ncbi:hypothetical protein NFI96_009624 [Prochilodus magdalenae]|nr:hypothetical protein NFI96_009624 [Prochilodus magdalenae]
MQQHNLWRKSTNLGKWNDDDGADVAAAAAAGTSLKCPTGAQSNPHMRNKLRRQLRLEAQFEFTEEGRISRGSGADWPRRSCAARAQSRDPQSHSANQRSRRSLGCWWAGPKRGYETRPGLVERGEETAEPADPALISSLRTADVYLVLNVIPVPRQNRRLDYIKDYLEEGQDTYTVTTSKSSNLNVAAEECSTRFKVICQIQGSFCGYAPCPPAPVVIAPGPPVPVVVAPGQPAPVVVAPGPPAPVVVAPGPPAPVVVAPAPSVPVVGAPGRPAPVVGAPGRPAPVAVAPGRPAPVVVAPGPPAPVVVAPSPPAPVVVAPGPPAPVLVVVAHGRGRRTLPACGRGHHTRSACARGRRTLHACAHGRRTRHACAPGRRTRHACAHGRRTWHAFAHGRHTWLTTLCTSDSYQCKVKLLMTIVLWLAGNFIRAGLQVNCNCLEIVQVRHHSSKERQHVESASVSSRRRISAAMVLCRYLTRGAISQKHSVTTRNFVICYFVATVLKRPCYEVDTMKKVLSNSEKAITSIVKTLDAPKLNVFYQLPRIKLQVVLVAPINRPSVGRLIIVLDEMTVVSSVNFRILTEGSTEYSEEISRGRSHSFCMETQQVKARTENLSKPQNFVIFWVSTELSDYADKRTPLHFVFSPVVKRLALWMVVLPMKDINGMFTVSMKMTGKGPPAKLM